MKRIFFFQHLPGHKVRIVSHQRQEAVVVPRENFDEIKGDDRILWIERKMGDVCNVMEIGSDIKIFSSKKQA